MRVALKSGAYTARSVIASCQRSVNLYGEANPEDAPVPFTYYPTPGLRALSTAPTAGRGRGLYRASNGVLYAVVGRTLYRVVNVETGATVYPTPVEPMTGDAPCTPTE